MSDVIMYHNPKCSKCRLTLGLLQEKGISPEVIKYLETPPSADELDEILDLLGIEPRELMRTGEAEYTENALDNPDLSREQLIQAMVEHPKLIQRPIVISNGRAAIGRPPEKILEIL